jgi:hypothetical protein
MSQTSITRYFNKRKRAGDEVKDRKKVFVVDGHDFAADISLSKKDHVIGKALALDTPESLHTVHKNKSLIEHVPVDCAKKLILENSKPVSCDSEAKPPRKHTDQKCSQGRSKETATQVIKTLIQPTIHHVLLKTNKTEAHYKAQPVNGATLCTSAEDGCFLVRYCLIKVDILNEMLTPFVFVMKQYGRCKLLSRSVLFE